MRSAAQSRFLLLLLPIALELLACAQPSAAELTCFARETEKQPELLERLCTPLIKDPKLDAPTKAEALLMRGFGRLKAGLRGEAVDDFDAGLRLAPLHDRLHRQRAHVAYDVGDMAGALNYARKSAEINPDAQRTFFLLSFIYRRLGDGASELAALNRTLELEPEHIEARYARAGLLMDAGRYRDAIDDTDRLFRLPPDTFTGERDDDVRGRPIGMWSAVRVRHAKVLGRLGRHEEGETILNAMIVEKPTAVSLISRSVFFLGLPVGMGMASRAADAARDAKAALTHDPDYAFAWLHLAICQQTIKQPAEALISLDTGLALADENLLSDLPETLWTRALLLRTLSRREEAIASALAAVDVSLLMSRWPLRRVFDRLRVRGYWQSTDSPDRADERVTSAVTACMIDTECW